MISMGQGKKGAILGRWPGSFPRNAAFFQIDISCPGVIGNESKNGLVMTQSLYLRWSKHRKWILLVLFLALLPLGFLVGERILGQRELGKTIQEIVKAGGTLDPLALAPPVSDGNTASLEDWKPVLKFLAELPQQGIEGVGWYFPHAMSEHFHGTAVPGWKQVDFQMGEQSFDWDVLEKVSADLDPLWNRLDPLLGKSRLDFGLDGSIYQTAWSGFPTSHGSWTKPLAQWLTLDALLHLRNQQPERAIQNVKRLVQLAQQLQHQPMLVFQAMQGSILKMAMNLTWSMQAGPSWSAEALESLESLFTGVDPVQGLEAAILMERAWAIERFRTMAVTGNITPMEAYLAGLNESSESSGPAHSWLWAHVWVDHDSARFLRIFGKELQTMAATNQGWTHPQTQALLLELYELSQPSSLKGLDRWRYPVSRSTSLNLIRRAASMKAQLALTIQSIRLERFRVAKGRYPESLGALEAWSQQASTRDPYGEGRLGYRSLEDGTYLLYSMGPDGKDDGGDASPPTRGEALALPAWLRDSKVQFFSNGRDMVWPRIQQPTKHLPTVASLNREAPSF